MILLKVYHVATLFASKNQQFINNLKPYIALLFTPLHIEKRLTLHALK